MLSTRVWRRLRHSGRPIEPLESRLLLATFFVSGTNGADTWTIRAGTTGVTVNGTFFANPGTTAVQIDGFDGNDTVFLTRATVPVFFNGGNHSDWINVGAGNVDEVSALVTFNGGGAIDTANIQDNFYANNTTYSAFGNQAERLGLGRITWDASCENLRIDAGTGSNSINVSALSTAIHTTVVGTTAGSDNVLVDMTGSGGNVSVFGNSGTPVSPPGVDSLQLSDFNNPSAADYGVFSSLITRGSKFIDYSDFESLILQGTGNAASTFDVASIAAATPTSLIGWSFGDHFNVSAGNGANYTLLGNLTLTGHGGHDTFAYNASPYTGGVPAVFTLTPTTVSSTGHAGVVTYGTIESVTLFGPNNDSDFNVLGTSPLLTGGTTIFAGNGSNDVTLFPYDGSGNSTLPTSLDVIGQNGTDSLIVDATASTVATDYLFFYSVSGGTCDIYGMGTGVLSADPSVDSIVVNAGGGNDTFNLETFATGNALSVNAGGGNDRFDIGLASGSLPTAISSMSAFNYNGGTGADELNIYNQNHPAAWSYDRATSAVGASAGAYFVNLLHFNTETIYFGAGAQADTFAITSALFGQKTRIHAAGGLDNVNISDFVSGDVEFAISQDLNTLTIGQNSRARMSAADGTAVYLRSLSIAAGAGGGRFDLRGNDLVYDWTGSDPIGSSNGSTYTGVTGMIQSAHNAGAWNGAGLTTSNPAAPAGLTTLGVASSHDVLGLEGSAVSTWNGFTVDATCVLVKYTYAGDANLDGFISGDDYAAIDLNAAIPNSSGWYNGDFNYDGIISGDDYATIDLNIVAQGTAL